jgi:hypothetical protein
MHPRKLEFLIFTLAGALSAAAIAQSPTPATPPTNPSTGTGATPGGTPPAMTAPGAGGATTTPPPAGGNSSPGNRVTLDFAAVDSDRNGFLSRAEASLAGLGGQFTILDKNNDGRLDPAEFAAHRPENVRIPDARTGTASSTTGTMSRR